MRISMVSGTLCVVSMCAAASGCERLRVIQGGPASRRVRNHCRLGRSRCLNSRCVATTVSAPGSPIPTSAPIDAEETQLIRVSTSCKTGSAVALQPADKVRMDPVARAKDGQPVVFGVARTAAGPPLTVTITVTKGGSVRTAHMTAYYPGLGQVA